MIKFFTLFRFHIFWQAESNFQSEIKKKRVRIIREEIINEMIKQSQKKNDIKLLTNNDRGIE